MEVRKIQNTASGSFFITLPKTWVNKMAVGKGEELIIAEDKDGSLRLNLLKNQEKYINEFVVQIEEYPEDNSLERCINSSYIQGSDVISIVSKSTITINKKSLIKDTTSNLIGTEISEEFSNKITIRILVDPVKFPLANLIKRIYTLVSSMHLDSIRAFNENDEILAKDVINREKEVDKLYYLMLRQLNLSLSNRLNIEDICTSAMKIDCVLGIILARDLSKMAHYAVEIAKQAIRLNGTEIDPEIKEHILKMSRFIIKMQQNAILAFFKSDFMRANKIINSSYKVKDLHLKTESEVLQRLTDINTIVSLITISRGLRNIANGAVAVSEDLQAKHRPKLTFEKQLRADSLVEPEIL